MAATKGNTPDLLEVGRNAMAHAQGKRIPKALRAGLPHYDEQGGIIVGRKKVNLIPSVRAGSPAKRRGRKS